MLRPGSVAERPHVHLQHEHVTGALEAVRDDLERAEVGLVDIDRRHDLRDFASSIGVERPVKVENCCLLKPPTMMVSGSPPLFHADCSTRS
jgi:hypothetical protein